MALTTTMEYAATLDEFAAHWQQVNAAYQAQVGRTLFLRGNYSIETLNNDKAAVNALMTQITNAENVLSVAIAQRDQKKTAIRERVRQFRASVQGVMGGSVYANSMPKQVQMGANTGAWIKTMDDITGLWATINANPPSGFTPPLTLIPTHAQEHFAAEAIVLKTIFTQITNAERDLANKRKQRDALIVPIKTRLVEYRKAVAGAFPLTNSLVVTLPKLSNAAGSTPDALNVSARWDAATNRAIVSWDKTTPRTDVAKVTLRACTGGKWKLSEAQAVPNTQAAYADGQIATTFGLVNAGDVVFLKAYVTNATGNVSGSNTVKVVRA